MSPGRGRHKLGILRQLKLIDHRQCDAVRLEHLHLAIHRRCRCIEPERRDVVKVLAGANSAVVQQDDRRRRELRHRCHHVPDTKKQAEYAAGDHDGQLPAHGRENALRLAFLGCEYGCARAPDPCRRCDQPISTLAWKASCVLSQPRTCRETRRSSRRADRSVNSLAYSGTAKQQHGTASPSPESETIGPPAATFVGSAPPPPDAACRLLLGQFRRLAAPPASTSLERRCADRKRRCQCRNPGLVDLIRDVFRKLGVGQLADRTQLRPVRPRWRRPGPGRPFRQFNQLRHRCKVAARQAAHVCRDIRGPPFGWTERSSDGWSWKALTALSESLAGESRQLVP